MQVMKIVSRLLIVLATTLMITGCKGYNKLLKSNDFEAKYEAAMKYYNDNSFSKAIQLFENLMLYYRGKEHAEDVLWYYAQSLLQESDYYTAAYQFKRFSRQYPYSDRASEAAFLSAYCKYEESPDYSLDQKSTQEAISEFEQFAEHYPTNPHIPEVNSYLDELRDKLMKKEYEIAYEYYNIEAYNAAHISLRNYVNLYPESPHYEEAMFYMLSAGYQYAINSTEEKMQERLQEVLNDFEKFSTAFPQSKNITKAQHIYTKARAMLTDLEQAKENTK